METEKAVWSEDQILTLLGALKKNTRNHTRQRNWKHGMKALDWNLIAFEPFSPEECRGKWDEILQRMCKIRTLPELIFEAEMANSHYLENTKFNPEYPKRPGPVYASFFKENFGKLKEEYPNVCHSKLVQHSAKKYKHLPEEEKQQYEEKYKHAIEDYRRRVIEFKKCSKSQQLKKVSKGREELQNDQEETNAEDAGLCPKIPQPRYDLFRKEQHDLMGEVKKEHGKKSNALTLQKDQETNTEDSIFTCKPPWSGYHLFCSEHPDLVVDVLEPHHGRVWKQHWSNLTQTQRNEYIRRCKEVKREHATKLTEFLEGLDVEEQEQILKKYNLKRPELPKGKRKVAQFLGEPKQPPRGAHVIFSSEKMKHLKGIKNSRQRFTVVNQMWRQLSKTEKAPYEKKLHKKVLKYAVELQRWFKTLSPTEQQQYRSLNPSRCPYLDGKYTPVHDDDDDEEVCEHQPSDSEDEEFEDSSSEDDEVITEDEEEEDDVIMFEMF